MLRRPLDQIESGDLDALITDQLSEGRTLDYKLELPGNSDAEKKEFLADVSSFANASGGDLLFGVDEAGGLPTSITGLSGSDLDAEIRRLDSIIESGLEPRIAYRTRLITHSSGKKVLLLRIQESWLAPHRVTYKGHDKFYSRNSAGKYPLDVGELRGAFLRTSTIAERIQAFRRDRITELAAERTPVPVLKGAKLILHLIPFESFSAPQQLDVFRYYDHPIELPPMRTPVGWSHKITLEGVLTYSSLEGDSDSYTHLYRSGIIEAVACDFLNIKDGGEYRIPSVSLERMCIDFTEKYLRVLQALGVAPPIYCFITLLGAKGRFLSSGRETFPFGVRSPISREVLSLPEAVFQNYSDKVATILRASIDALWHECGFRGSPNFQADGSWVPKS